MAMTMNRERTYREMAARGKYRDLYAHLCRLTDHEWRTSFGEIESIIGYPLPPSARLHRPWWSNQSGGSGHSQALAWGAAGWETAEVDLENETLLFRRKQVATSPEFTLDQLLPVHSAGAWPERMSLGREDIYGERA